MKQADHVNHLYTNHLSSNIYVQCLNYRCQMPSKMVLNGYSVKE